MRDFNLKAHSAKCTLGTHELLYLGHKIDREGNRPDPAKCRIISEMPPPATVTQVRAFLGLIGYYRRFIHRMSQRARPLHELLHLDQPWKWTSSQQAAFVDLKDCLLEPPVLKRPNFDQPFILQTDWSREAIAAVLCQIHDGEEHPKCYAGRDVNPAEKNYAATEGECLAVVWAVKYFRQYLYGRTFTLQTDHSALKWLMETKDLSGRLARWSLKLQEYDFVIQDRPGNSNGNADALSRLPEQQENLEYEHGDTRSPMIIYANLMSCRAPARLLKKSNPVQQPDLIKETETQLSQGALSKKPSEESISIHLPCQLCGQEYNWKEMLICDGGGEGFHMACLEPRVNSVPDGPWYCGNCEGDTQTTIKGQLDILDDEETLSHLMNPEGIEDLSDQQKERVMRRSNNYVVRISEAGDVQVFRKPVGSYNERRVPKTGERETIVERYHKLGHFGVLRTAKLVSQDFYWGGIIQTTRQYINNCHQCRIQRAKS